MPWAFEPVANPSVLRLHTTAELTPRTIETCPPGQAPSPLDRVLAVDGVRSIDLHRYLARLNLEPGVGADDVRASAAEVLGRAWGEEAELPTVEPPRRFPVPYEGPRRVAESLEMARDEPVLRALFAVEGVAEAILDQGTVTVRLARLFRWANRAPAVAASIDRAVPR